MKLTNYEVFTKINILQELSPKVTGKLAYAISRNMRKMQNEVIEFDALRNELVCKYGDKQENGDYLVSKDSENYKKFIDELNEYGSISHEIDIYTIDAETLYNSDLNANEMYMLDFMIND